MMEVNEETRAVLRDIAEDAAFKAVNRTLTALGVDHGNPLSVQRDFAAMHEVRTWVTDDEFRKDMLHIRKWRLVMERVEGKGISTVIWGFVVTCLVGAAYAFRLKLGFNA